MIVWSSGTLIIYCTYVLILTISTIHCIHTTIYYTVLCALVSNAISTVQRPDTLMSTIHSTVLLWVLYLEYKILLGTYTTLPLDWIPSMRLRLLFRFDFKFHITCLLHSQYFKHLFMAATWGRGLEHLSSTSTSTGKSEHIQDISTLWYCLPIIEKF